MSSENLRTISEVLDEVILNANTLWIEESDLERVEILNKIIEDCEYVRPRLRWSYIQEGNK